MPYLTVLRTSGGEATYSMYIEGHLFEFSPPSYRLNAVAATLSRLSVPSSGGEDMNRLSVCVTHGSGRVMPHHPAY